MTQEIVTFAEIVAELKRICREQKTGTLYITSQLNRSAQVVVDSGNIVFLYYFNKRGQDALKLLPEVESGRFRFQEGSIPSMRIETLITEDILRFLSAATGEFEKSGKADLPAVHEKEKTTEGGVSLTEEQKRMLEEGLALYIGPMASFICEDHLSREIDMKLAIERLAGEIPEDGQAKLFIQDMMQQLAS